MRLFPFAKKTYIPLNTVYVSSKNLLHNYAYLSSLLPHQKVAPVLKSNAYGHGIIQVAQILDKVGAPFFCVDSIYEGYQLIKAHIKTPILIVGYVTPENLSYKKLPFSYVVYSLDMLKKIYAFQPQANIHIFVDTGMHREGFLPSEIPQLVEYVKKNHIKVTGLLSHFAFAENISHPLTQKQMQTFLTVKQVFTDFGITPEYIHMQASAAILGGKTNFDFLTVARSGLALYGISEQDKHLQPALSLFSTIVQIKNIKKNEGVGYEFSFLAKRNMKLALIPIGYNDGMNKKLSNKGYVRVKNTYCPIVGAISMNMSVIDVSNVKNISVGDSVEIYSSDAKNKNSIVNCAKLCGLSFHELLVSLHPSTKRIIV